ncbi:MAG: DUF4418 family protein [Coriobacteriia bacterium]|nr:DUF4418 family protein [Coriobacteriia bacterium]
MRSLGIGLVLIAVLVALVPAYNNCTYDQNFIQLPLGGQINMTCYWTSRAAIVIAIPLGLVGLMLALSRGKETRRSLSVLGGVLSALTIMLPTVFFGVCGMNSSCSIVMRPSLIALGGLGVVAAIAAFVLAGRPSEEVPPSEGAAA